MTAQERYLSAALLELVARERATRVRLVLWLSDGNDLARRWCARLKREWSEELPRDEWRVHFVRQPPTPGR